MKSTTAGNILGKMNGRVLGVLSIFCTFNSQEKLSPELMHYIVQ
jgi:hypothetical protein